MEKSTNADLTVPSHREDFFTPISDTGKGQFQLTGVGSSLSICAIKVRYNMTSSTSIESEESSEDTRVQWPTPKVSTESIELSICENSEWLGKRPKIRDTSNDWVVKCPGIRDALNKSPPLLNPEEVPENREHCPTHIFNCGNLDNQENPDVFKSFESTNAIRTKVIATFSSTSMTSEESVESLGNDTRLDTVAEDCDESIAQNREEYFEKRSKEGEPSRINIVKNIQTCMEDLNIQHMCTVPLESILKTIMADFFTREKEIEMIRKKYNMDKKVEVTHTREEPKIPTFITVVNHNANSQSSVKRNSSNHKKSSTVTSHVVGKKGEGRNKRSTSKRSVAHGGKDKAKINSIQSSPKNENTKARNINADKSNVPREDVFTRLYNKRKPVHRIRVDKAKIGPVREPFQIYSQPNTRIRKALKQG